jgi:hypothetical protein
MGYYNDMSLSRTADDAEQDRRDGSVPTAATSGLTLPEGIALAVSQGATHYSRVTPDCRRYYRQLADGTYQVAVLAQGRRFWRFGGWRETVEALPSHAVAL